MKPEIAFVNTCTSNVGATKLILSAYKGVLFLTFKVIGPGREYSQIDYQISDKNEAEVMALIDAVEEADDECDMRDVINEFYPSLIRFELDCV